LAPQSAMPGEMRGQEKLSKNDPQMTQMDADLEDHLARLLNRICAHLRHLRIIPSYA
jgi:hypothetical protein